MKVSLSVATLDLAEQSWKKKLEYFHASTNYRKFHYIAATSRQKNITIKSRAVVQAKTMGLTMAKSKRGAYGRMVRMNGTAPNYSLTLKALSLTWFLYL